MRRRDWLDPAECSFSESSLIEPVRRLPRRNAARSEHDVFDSRDLSDREEVFSSLYTTDADVTLDMQMQDADLTRLVDKRAGRRERLRSDLFRSWAGVVDNVNGAGAANGLNARSRIGSSALQHLGNNRRSRRSERSQRVVNTARLHGDRMEERERFPRTEFLHHDHAYVSDPPRYPSFTRASARESVLSPKRRSTSRPQSRATHIGIPTYRSGTAGYALGSAHGNGSFREPSDPVRSSTVMGRFDLEYDTYGEDFVANSRRSRHFRRNYSSDDGQPQMENIPPQNNGGVRYQQTMRPSSACATMSPRQADPDSLSDSGRSYVADVDDSSLPQQPPMAQSIFSQQEIYLFGSLRVPLSQIEATVCASPPPAHFFSMQIFERVAYLYHHLLFGAYVEDFQAFHNSFNRDFYTLVADGTPEQEALYQICGRMQAEYLEFKRIEDEKRAEEERQRKESEEEAARQAVTENTPKKFTTRHAFMRFGGNGRVVTVTSRGAVVVNTMHEVLSVTDRRSAQLLETLSSFKGPLDSTRAAPHSVALFIRRQMERIRKEGRAIKDKDSILLWRLLLTLVQQYGKVTGPDLSSLLTDNGTTMSQTSQLISRTPQHNFQETSPGNLRGIRPYSPVQKFTEFVVGGHVEEAIDVALSHDLYAEAVVLALRVAPSQLDAVVKKIISRLPSGHPFSTLLTVSANEPLEPSALDDESWRVQVACVLANLNTESAMQSVYAMGRTLQERSLHQAAHFCLLAVTLLSNIDPFRAESVDGCAPQASLTLINITAEDQQNTQNTRLGFNLIDFYATEIFSYALSLNTERQNPLLYSVPYQTTRLSYARMLAGLGLSDTALSYCTHIAQSIWSYLLYFPHDFLHDLADLGDQIACGQCDATASAQWVEILRGFLSQPGTWTSFPGQNSNSPLVGQNPDARVLDGAREEVPTATQNGIDFEDLQQHDQREQPVTTQVVESMAHAEQVMPATVPYANGYSDVEGATPTVIEQELPSAESEGSGAPTVFMPYTTEASSLASEEYVDVSSPLSSSSPVFMNAEEEFSDAEDSDSSSSASSSPTHATDAASRVSGSRSRTSDSCLELEGGNLVVVPNEKSAVNDKPTMATPMTAPVTIAPVRPSSALDGNSENQKPPVKPAKSKGLLDRIRSSITKALPVPAGAPPMRLPDDSVKTIVWDPELKRYIGEGVEDNTAQVGPPPPSMSGAHSASQPSGPPTSAQCGGSLRQARGTRGARYCNQPINSAGNLKEPSAAPSFTMTPPPMMPASMFMPAAPIGDSDGSTPFSDGPVELASETTQE